MSIRSQRKFRIRPWQIAGLLLLLSTGGLLLYGFWPAVTGSDTEQERDLGENLEEARSPVDVIVLDRVEFPLRAEATGHLATWRRAVISAEASGIVVDRPVEEGYRVQEGAVLLQLDDRDQLIRLQEAEAAVLKARVEYGVDLRMSGDVPAADTTDLAVARTRLREAQQAFDAGNLTSGELADMRRRFDALNVLAGNQQDAVRAVTTNLTQSEQLLERARLDLSRTRVLAPFAGRVADLKVEIGQRLGAGTEILTLLEDSRMKVAVDVLEADLVHISEGATANVRIPSFSEEVFLGRVFAVNPVVDPKTGTGRVTVALPNPGGRLVAGLFADVALERGRLQDRLVVPKEALLVRQGRDLVFRVVKGHAFWTYVNVGARSGKFAEVTQTSESTSSLAPGDSILVAGHHALAHDTPIEINSVVELGLQ